MRRLLLVVALFFGAHYAHAGTCPLASGGNLAAAVASCGSGNTVTLAAGSYAVGSSFTLPCGVSIAGPTVPYSQTHNQTAVINGSLGIGVMGISTSAGCSVPQTISFVEWNGGTPTNGTPYLNYDSESPPNAISGNLNPAGSGYCKTQNGTSVNCGNGGGNFLHVVAGTNGITITNSYIHGNNCGFLCGSTNANLINFDQGPYQNQCCTPSGSTTNNVNITWNIFGNAGVDCLQAGLWGANQNTEGGGGYCNGVGLGGLLTNVTIENNIFHGPTDNEVKYYEAMTDSQTLTGTSGLANPLTIKYNDFSQYDRIGYEGQINWGGPSEPTLEYLQYNDFHDPTNPHQQDFDISMANGCIYGFNTSGMTNCVNHMDYNVAVMNTPAVGCGSVGFEFWGGVGSTANGNFWNGSSNYMCTTINYAPSGQFTANNNTAYITGGGGNTGGCGLWNVSINGAAFNPSCSGNVNGPNGTITSVAPVLSVSGGTITITNTNVSSPNGSNPGRDSNTTFWCTTNGNTPSPGGSGSTPYWVGSASQTVASVTPGGNGTIKCVGMWGAPNQPYSYDSGLGYVPSAVVSANYTSGCVDNITSYGAVGNGSTDNTTAIQNAFNAAASASPQCSVEIPNGTFNHSGTITATGISVFGLGSGSILQATNVNTQAVILLGTSPSLTNLVVNGTGTSRQTSANPSAVLIGFNSSGSVVATSNFVVNNVAICCAENVGIYNFASNGGTVENVTVHNTYADSITNVEGANNILEQNNLIYNSGDDGMSNNSYTSDSTTVNHITITENTVLPGSARGLECSGCSNATFTNNWVDHDDSDADLFISSETSSYQTKAVSNITATGNTFVRGGPGQGAVEIWADGSSNSVTNVTLNNNTWYNTLTFTGIQLAGAGTVSGIAISDSNAYINPVAFCTDQISGGSCASSPHVSSYSNNNTFNTTTAPGPSYGAGTVPIFSLPSGNYTLPQTLTLNEPTASDTMAYCTTTGTSCTPGTAYGSSITISTPQTICALGTNSAGEIPVASAVVCATYNAGSLPPPLTQCYQANACSPDNTLNVGGTCQQQATCYYASLPAPGTTNCSTTDAYGNGVTAWGPASSSVISVGQIGSAHPGLITGLSAGTASSTATVTGGVSCSSWNWTVNNVTPTLSSAAMVIQAGGSSVPVGGTAQMCVNLAYVSPTENTQVCGSGTDAYGTTVNTYTSSSPSNATIVSSTGILTGVATGSTTVQASVNSGAYTPSLAVSVVVPSVTPAGLMQGAALLQGNGGLIP